MKINARLLAPDVALSLWSLLHYEIASKKKKKIPMDGENPIQLKSNKQTTRTYGTLPS